MFRHNNGQFKVTPPATVVFNGFTRNFSDLNREEWDEIGYNEAIQIKREPFTTYETQWKKGDDLIYREEIVSMTTDEVAQVEACSSETRKKRDSLLSESDWSQLADSPLSEAGKTIWQEYRQSLRDIPQQAEFPTIVQWPDQP